MSVFILYLQEFLNKDVIFSCCFVFIVFLLTSLDFRLGCFLVQAMFPEGFPFHQLVYNCFHACQTQNEIRFLSLSCHHHKSVHAIDK